MNAVILAAGNSSRMQKSGIITHKPLLRINDIPNIERTIILLHDSGIDEITIICGKFFSYYEYLKKKYNCALIMDENASKSTLYGISSILDRFGDTFIIEGDVVLTYNIFQYKSYSYYYTICYPYPEADSWLPIVDKTGRVQTFHVGLFDEPCIFGVSFWSKKDAKLIKTLFKSICNINTLYDSNKFWDDYFVNILDQLPIYTIELSSKAATEMNTQTEYIRALDLCKNYYSNVDCYFLNLPAFTVILPSYAISDTETISLQFEKDSYLTIQYTNKLLEDYNKKHPDDLQILNNTLSIAPDEYAYIITTTNSCHIGFITIAVKNDYILLRRIYIDSKFRNQSLGSEIVKKVITYARITNRELRVNVYDDYVKSFYFRLGFQLNFTNYKLPLKTEGENNEYIN